MKSKRHYIKVAYLDKPNGAAIAGDALAAGEIAVVDYGSTFGTAFLPFLRKKVAQVRKEPEPLATVSLVMIQSQAMRWIDFEKIHPSLGRLIKEGHLEELEGVSFLRFPASETARQMAGEYHVNSTGEVQFFLVPESDKLMKHLRDKHGIHYIGVRSANIHGEPEETTFLGAKKFASKINANVVALLGKDYLEREQGRQRVGSQPILKFSQFENNEQYEIKLVRAGNTHPETMRKILAKFQESGSIFRHEEEKIGPPRVQYLTPEHLSDAKEIKQHLLTVSGLG